MVIVAGSGRRSIFWFLAILVIAGCVSRPAPRQSVVRYDREVRQRSLEKIQDWQIQGRLAVRTEQDGWTASMFWRQQRQQYDVKVAGPLGRGAFRITGEPGSVILRSADHGEHSASSGEALMLRVLGWQLPVTGFPYWVRGLPAPDHGEAQQVFDEQGRLDSLIQSGWTIQYLQYKANGTVELPTRIRFASDNLEVRLVVKKWTLHT